MYWSTVPCLLSRSRLPFSVPCAILYLRDHQLQIRGWLTISDHHGNAELLLYERYKEWLYFTPSRSGNEGQPSFNCYLSWFKYLLKASDYFSCSRFPKCLTICSVPLTMCLCCQSHKGKKSKCFIFFVNGICWDDINHTDRELSTHEWMHALNIRAVNRPCFWSLLS